MTVSLVAIPSAVDPFMRGPMIMAIAVAGLLAAGFAIYTKEASLENRLIWAYGIASIVVLALGLWMFAPAIEDPSGAGNLAGGLYVVIFGALVSFAARFWRGSHGRR